MQLSNDQIRQILPHRHPFLLVDIILDYQPGEWAKGLKCVSANEMLFLGHFPAQSVFPGVLIVEALAQTGAIAILTQPEYAGRLVFFGGIKNAKFRRPVVPGEVLSLECRLTRMMGKIGLGEGVATVDGELACQAEFTFAIDDRR